MAMKNSHTTIVCLLLFIFIIISHLHFSHGEEDSVAYDIDYRGPETHPSMAPPSHFGGRPWTRRRDFGQPPKDSRHPTTRPKEAEKIKG